MTKSAIGDVVSPQTPRGADERSVSRRNILLAGTTLAAASALGAATPTRVAQAQPAAPSGRKPNILVM